MPREQGFNRRENIGANIKNSFFPRGLKDAVKGLGQGCMAVGAIGGLCALSYFIGAVFSEGPWVILSGASRVR